MSEIITGKLIFDGKRLPSSSFHQLGVHTIENVSDERFTGLSRDTRRFLSCDRAQKKDKSVSDCA